MDLLINVSIVIGTLAAFALVQQVIAGFIFWYAAKQNKEGLKNDYSDRKD